MTWTPTRTRFLGKMLVAASIVSALVFVLSCRWNFGIILDRDRVASVESGSLLIVWVAPVGDWTNDSFLGLRQFGPFFARRSRAGLTWRWVWNLSSTGDIHLILIPLWLPTLLLLAPGLYLLYRTRHLPGHCRGCRYNLAGLPPNSPCPECGRARPAA